MLWDYFYPDSHEGNCKVGLLRQNSQRNPNLSSSRRSEVNHVVTRLRRFQFKSAAYIAVVGKIRAYSAPPNWDQPNEGGVSR